MTERIGEFAQTTIPLPLASSYDNHKRLVRGGTFSQLKPEPRAGGVVTTKRKLEDYLDPVLLATMSVKIGGAKKDASQSRKLKREEVKEFDWPAEELKVLGTAMRENVENIEAVDLGCDFAGDESLVRRLIGLGRGAAELKSA